MFHKTNKQTCENSEGSLANWKLPKLDINVYFWLKQKFTFSEISIAIVDSHQNFILYIDIISWDCNSTRLIRIACTISPAIATDCWLLRQENLLPSAAFLFNKDSKSVEKEKPSFAGRGRAETMKNFYFHQYIYIYFNRHIHI